MKIEDLKEKIRQEPFTSLWIVIYDYLYHNIITLDIPPGTRITESQFASELKVSRSPIKMALDKLVEDNLVEKSARKGYCVSLITHTDCWNLYEARVGIEGYAAYLAAKRISDDQLRRLSDLCKEYKRMDQGGTLTGFPEVDHEFHQIIIDAAGNSYISHLYDSIKRSILRYRYYTTTLSAAKAVQLYPYHHAIFSALKNHASSLAQEEIVQDINSMYTTTMQADM